ncbi:histone deacetylase 6 isoform X2 [Caloenas nicobarica]|uniref:histone deacetylase 6 isoform X2 n=1 Tax=Caloenas nicobarica TaxID=187106 RepID=UPI0032B78FED
MGRAGRRGPAQRGAGLPELKRRGRARSRREGLEAELQRLDLGAEAAAPTGTGLVYDEEFAASVDGSPPEAPEPLSASWAKLEQLGLAQRCVRVQCRPATDEELLLVHSPDYLARMELNPTPAAGSSRRAVGSLLSLLRKVLSGDVRNGLALLGPPGRHEEPDGTSGRFNGVAIAAKEARSGGQRVLLVDWCSRPSWTLPRLFQDDPGVLYFGVHGGPAPPGPPRPLSVHVCWEEVGVTSGDFAAAFLQLLLPLGCQFQPQVVVVAAAFDTGLGAPQGHIGMTPEGLALLTHLLGALAGGRLLLALEGPAEQGGVGAVLRALLGDSGDPPPACAPSPGGLASVARALATYGPFWSCLRRHEPRGEEDDEEQQEDEEEAEALGGPEEAEEPPGTPPEEDGEEEEEEEEAAAAPWPRPAARTALLHDQRMEEHVNPWDSQHPERPQRLRRILERLEELGLAQRCLRLRARLASVAQLRACHTASHVGALSACRRLSPRELQSLSGRYPSLFLCPRSFRCARLAAGAACAAVSAVLGGRVQNALAVVRPPGHHAGPGSAGGFCLFNNVAVAARHGQRLAGGALRVLIVDWDVHHGNGTQEIFEDDPSVLYVSLHRHDGSFFPGGPGGSPRRRGRGGGSGFTLNVGWGGPRAGDADYLAAMTRLVLPVALQFAPQLVLVSAGFDAGRGDPLGGCLVSPQTFGLMTHLLGALAGGRLVLVLEGGYNLGVTAEGVAQCLGVLLGNPPVLPPPGAPQPAALGALARTCRLLEGAWTCLRLPAPPAEPPKGEDGDDVTRPPDDVTGGPPTPLDTVLRLERLHLGAGPPPGHAQGAEPPPDPTQGAEPPDPAQGVEPPPDPAQGVEPPPDPAQGVEPPDPAQGVEPPPDPAQGVEPPLDITQGAELLADTGHGAGLPPGSAPWLLWEELEEGAPFAVTPLRDCPHLGAVAPPPGGRVLREPRPPCAACGSRRENWVCLSCYQVLCGRYVRGHMEAHGGAHGHPLVLSLRDLSSWCYRCGGYVQDQVLLPAKTLVYRLKFGSDPPTLSL